MKTFILQDKLPVQVDQNEFVQWMTAQGDRYPKVADDEVAIGVRVLTQFMGTDPHGGDVYLFETRVCGGDYDGYTQRVSTWDMAEKCHLKTKQRVSRWVMARVDPADFIQDISSGLLVRWGFTPTDEGSEYERTIRQVDEVPGFDGLNLVVRPDDGAVCLQEYAEDGRVLNTVALNNVKTVGGVMRLVNALKGES